MRDRELRTKDEHMARLQEQFQLLYGELKTAREVVARQQNAPWLRAGPDVRSLAEIMMSIYTSCWPSSA